MSLSDPSVLTLGAVGALLGCKVWQVRRLFERGFLPPARRCGPYRVIARRDLHKVEAALRKAGYLKAEPASV